MMEITILKMLLKNISSFYQLSSHENTKCEPIDKYYCKTDEILKLLKPILDDIIDIDIASHEKLHKALSGTIQYIDELKETFENWQPLMSKVYLVFQAESLISKIQASALEIYELLISFEESELSVASLEQTIQKTKNIELEKTSDIITKAIKDQNEGPGASPESLAKVADYVSLNSNQELLIEAVALEKLKENAEQGEKNNEVEFIDQMLNLVTHMHDQLVMFKQSQSCSPVTIPPDFCCPLSIELMTDPVIVASGQTYERAFIRNWIDLGLNVCPKTRQPLSHSNLIPNYTVKALIANWCESNNVKLPDPIKSMSLNQPSALLGKIDSNVLTQSRVNPSINNTSPDRGSNVASSHHHSSSEESLPELPLPENGHELNIENTNEEASQSHIRTASASSTVSISKLSLGTSSDNGNESNNNDVTSDEVTSQPTRQVETMTNLPLRVSEFPSRTRNQQIWRRPSDRFVPRIVQSSSTETRPDLSEVEARVKSLIEELKNPSINEQRKATSDLRLLAKHNMDNRIVIANCGAIPILVNLLLSTDSEIQENAVTALLNLSINDNNKAAIANANAIEPLIYVLETGSSEAKENSAATLFSLSVIEDNKVKIGRSGAIKPLVDLLGNGTPRGKKDASTALFNLSILHENKGRIVQAGAVKYLVELMDPAAGMVDKAVAVLSNLATIPEGRLAIGQEGGITVLVEVVELGSARGKENAAAALLQLCTNSSRFCNMVLQEGAVPPLVALLQSGTPRAREKAQALLSYFRNQRHGNAGRG